MKKIYEKINFLSDKELAKHYKEKGIQNPKQAVKHNENPQSVGISR